MNMASKLLLTSSRQSLAVDSDTSAEDGSSKTVPAFITLQSLVTFPGSAVAVTIVWRFFDSLLGIDSRLVPVVAAFLVGGALYWMSLEENLSRRDRVLGAGIAVINAMYLAMSVLGIDITLGAVDVGVQPTP